MAVANSGLLDGLRRIGGKFRDLTIDGGLPGAPLGYRLRGATASGPPLTGTWKAGDLVPDRTGMIWICTAGGTGPAASWSVAAPAGPTGPSGPAGAAGLNWRGTYSSAATYAVNDACQYLGSSFICIAGTTGVAPGSPSAPATGWSLLSSIGNAGPTGPGVAGSVVPANMGFAGWAFDPIYASSSTATVLGEIIGTKIIPPAQAAVGIAYYVNTAGVGLVAGENFWSVYDSSGNLGASTPDCSGATNPVSTTSGSATVTAPGTTYTVTTTAASATVTGTGFTASMVGQQFTIAGVTGTFTISAVASSTSLTTTVVIPTTVTSQTMTPVGFIAAMVGAQYTIAGVTGTFTVQSVASPTSLTMSTTIPTTVSVAIMTPTANFSWLTTGMKYTPWAGTYSYLNAANYASVLANGNGTIPKFQSTASGLPTTLINGLISPATFRSGQLGGLTSQSSLPSSVTIGSSTNTNATFWVAIY